MRSHALNRFWFLLSWQDWESVVVRGSVPCDGAEGIRPLVLDC